MRENLDNLQWKEKDKKCGQTVESMKEILRMERKMEKELLNGLMEINMLEVGEGIRCMELVYISTKRKKRKNRENG